MKVQYELSLEASDGSTFMRMGGEIPFVPQPGHRIRFCKGLCCDGVEVGRVVTWSHAEERLELFLTHEWDRMTLEEMVSHFAACGFVEAPEMRETFEAADALPR